MCYLAGFLWLRGLGMAYLSLLLQDLTRLQSALSAGFVILQEGSDGAEPASNKHT